jgi:histone RNA hairpin-binding protein
VQRQKQINKGKNTVGYDEYCRRVPKNLRRPRCMDTPSTPDYTLDIPNRQWNGMVKAW